MVPFPVGDLLAFIEDSGCTTRSQRSATLTDLSVFDSVSMQSRGFLPVAQTVFSSIAALPEIVQTRPEDDVVILRQILFPVLPAAFLLLNSLRYSATISRIRSGGFLQRVDLTTRAVAGFVDFLLIVGLSRLPDVLGFLSATGYILIRDGLYEHQSIGKKLIGIRVTTSEPSGPSVSYRESIIRNVTYAAAYLLFLIPYAGWVLGPLVVGAECLAAIGDERGMRVGDLIARTVVVQQSPLATRTSEEPQHHPVANPSGAASTLDTRQP